jgi:hypothetical protein
VVVEESVGIWPRKDVSGPELADEPAPLTGLPVESLQTVIDRMKDAREIVDGDPNPSIVDEFPVTWKGWRDVSDDGWVRRGLWETYSTNIDLILNNGNSDDVKDEWMIQADHDINEMSRIGREVKIKTREVIARAHDEKAENDPHANDEHFAGLTP